MLTAGPGQSITVSQSGLPTGASVGYQVIKAASGTVAIGRTTVGVVERPASSGNYVATFTVPAEADLYLIVLDWSGGVLAPATTKVEELQVTSLQAAETGLGAIADNVKVYLGGETFDGIATDSHAGEGTISLAISNIKARVFTSPPVTSAEVLLPQIVLSYLGKVGALELLPAARAYWNSQVQSESVGHDPTEVTVYPSRQAMLDKLADELLAAIRRDWPTVLPFVDAPLLRLVEDGPSIDEDDDSRHVTRDPRVFPLQESFPYSKFDPLTPPGVRAL